MNRTARTNANETKYVRGLYKTPENEAKSIVLSIFKLKCKRDSELLFGDALICLMPERKTIKFLFID